METETELKAKDGTTGTEKLFFISIWNHIATADEIEDFRANASPRNLKKLNAAIVPVTVSWKWEFGYTPRTHYPTLYRTNEKTTRDDTGERIG